MGSTGSQGTASGVGVARVRAYRFPTQVTKPPSSDQSWQTPGVQVQHNWDLIN